MAFVPPDNLRALIRQYYRRRDEHIPENYQFSPKSFLFVTYHCEHGYELADEINTMYCMNNSWVSTRPLCEGRGAFITLTPFFMHAH
jgi:hypothetical protein